ncbi:MAG: hypothetical protein JNL70_01510 [Saprospiraceae bacterium]|nr:hypothetical protein [Saprospiraceae bacterium]
MIIGIGGVSRSGKSTLAALIKDYFTVRKDSYGEGGQSAVVLSQDDFVFPVEQIPSISKDGEVEIDWEIPESIDFQRYKTAILEAERQFDHVITEGLLNFYDETINALFDKFFLVNITKETFLKRKSEDKRWGEVPAWYVQHIWESYEKYGRTILKDKNKEVVEISGTRTFDVKKYFE